MICPASDYCCFYQKKFFYDDKETEWYAENCLNDGGVCGLYVNYKNHHKFEELERRLMKEKKIRY